jgi:hypothetical protein
MARLRLAKTDPVASGIGNNAAEKPTGGDRGFGPMKMMARL